MQNDLISKNALIEELKKCTCTDKHDERIIKDFVIHIIEQQPIAYNVEKIMQQIEKLPTKTGMWEYAETGRVHILIEKSNVIEIIRNGEINNESTNKKRR